MHFLRLMLVAFFLLLTFSASQSQAEQRVALVIGNSDYGAEMGKLPNPANDAALMAKTLKQVGFDVISITNADQNKMKQAIKEFGRKLTAAGSEATGLFFYAGHGLQVGGENYLVPVHAAIEQEGDVDVEAVPASMVLRQMDFSGSSVNIVILDACRNNPLARSMRSATRGLAEIRERPTGSFIAYSTAPGQTAVDGKGKNSPYTLALAAAIVTPGAGIEEVFRTVRGKVLKETDQKQVPWDASSLTAPFFFVPPSAGSTSTASSSSSGGNSAPAAPVDSKQQVEVAYWESIKDSTNTADFEAYLKKYPDGDFVDLARIRIAKLKDTKVASAAQANDGGNLQRDTGEASQGAGASASSAPEFEPLDQTIHSKNGAVVRARPDSNASTLKKLSGTQALTATGISTDGNWWRVRMSGGKIGYIHKAVVAEPSAEAMTASADTTSSDAVDTTADAAAGSANFIEPIEGGYVAPTPTYQTQPQPSGPTITFGGGGGNAQVNGFGALAQILGNGGGNTQQQATVRFSPQSRKLLVRGGTIIRPAASFAAPPIARLTADGELQAAARSSDGLWWRIRMPDGRTGFIESNGVIE